MPAAATLESRAPERGSPDPQQCPTRDRLIANYGGSPAISTGLTPVELEFRRWEPHPPQVWLASPRGQSLPRWPFTNDLIVFMRGGFPQGRGKHVREGVRSPFNFGVRVSSERAQSQSARNYILCSTPRLHTLSGVDGDRVASTGCVMINDRQIYRNPVSGSISEVESIARVRRFSRSASFNEWFPAPTKSSGSGITRPTPIWPPPHRKVSGND